MSEPLIPEGCILLSRKLLNSGIFNKPPLYIKVWVYLLARAQHKDYKGLKRGQLWTSIPEIQKACSYNIGFRKEIPTKKQIFDVLEWLRNPYEADSNGTMITTMKGTHGILVTIEKYALYQDIKNYERNNEGNDEEPTKGTTREQYKQKCINECNKNDNKDIVVFQQVIDTYNKICVSYSRVTKLSESRKKAIKARLNTYTMEDFIKLFQTAEESEFLKGKNNRDWSANLDWLIKDSNMAKVLDGNYSKKGSVASGEQFSNNGFGYVKTGNELLEELRRDAESKGEKWDAETVDDIFK